MDQGNTAFLLICAALVLLMTPGLAFFYGGLVKAKSVISMMMMSFGAMGLIGVLWVLYGYAIAFPGAEGTLAPWMVDWSALGLDSLLETPEGAAYPPLAFVAFQATFAIITVALVSGAIADRAKFGSWMIFAALWATIVYFPVASWVFNFGLAEDGSFAYGGWITHGLQDVFGVGAIDFAGGTAVSASASASRRASTSPTTRRSSCSAPVCSGSAGSASTRAPSSPPTAPRPSRSSTPSRLPRRRCSPG
ncbi:MAG: ammonium transporter [Microbacterium sp.]|nr:ammonium transporter [Microbacterium sp.]